MESANMSKCKSGVYVTKTGKIWCRQQLWSCKDSSNLKYTSQNFTRM